MGVEAAVGTRPTNNFCSMGWRVYADIDPTWAISRHKEMLAVYHLVSNSHSCHPKRSWSFSPEERLGWVSMPLSNSSVTIRMSSLHNSRIGSSLERVQRRTGHYKRT